jgi:carbonic anhydrase/acetyltransferase-like protein (isoleucine patch superfamily)
MHTRFAHSRKQRLGLLSLVADICSRSGPEDRGYTRKMIRSYQGHTPAIPESCYVDVSAQVIGDVVLGEHASVWMNAVVRGDVHSIRVGAHSNVQDCAVLHGMRYLYPVIVGEYVTIGHNATVHGCVVEDTCLIGMGATIMNNARIGEGSIVAAGALIPEGAVIPPKSLVAGVPGKVRRELTSDDRDMILKYARNYLDYTKIYLEERKNW